MAWDLVINFVGSFVDLAITLIAIGLPAYLVGAALRRIFRLNKAKPLPTDLVASKRVWARMKRMAQPTLMLVPAVEAAFSKLGGEPELPAEMGWPVEDTGPRAFLAQIDLAEVRAAGGPEWLPEAGRLYAFFAKDWWAIPARCGSSIPRSRSGRL